MVSTPLKNIIKKWESSPIFGVKIKHIGNHHPENILQNFHPQLWLMLLGSILDEFTSAVFTVKTWRVGYHHGGTFKPKTQHLANKSTTIRIQPMVASYQIISNIHTSNENLFICLNKLWVMKQPPICHNLGYSPPYLTTKKWPMTTRITFKALFLASHCYWLPG